MTVPIRIKRPTWKITKPIKSLQDRFDRRYMRNGQTAQFTQGQLVPVQGKTVTSDNIKGELYVTIGDRRSKLPASTPISYLGSDCSPDNVAKRSLGNITNQWWKLWVNNLTIRRRQPINGKINQVNYDIESWLSTIGEFLSSNKFVCESGGSVNIKITRPCAFDSTRGYTSLKHWSVVFLWSPFDIDNDTGLGAWRACSDTATALTGGCEGEIEDTGSDEYLYARFRNFNNFRVVVSVRVIA